MQTQSPERPRAAELLGELARELSRLVRRDSEVAMAERLPTLRRALLDLAALLVVAVAALFALAAVSIATGSLLSRALPGWTAALVVAAGWSVVALVLAAVLLRPRAQPREREELLGLVQMLARDHDLEQLRASREQVRDEAEGQMRETAGAVVEALLEEAAEHQLKALPQLAKREAEEAEADATDLLVEALSLVTAPARAGWRALERIAEPPLAPPATGAERPARNRKR